jgi:hypothetical protein
LFANSSSSRLGHVLAARLLPQSTFKNFRPPFASTFAQQFRHDTDRFRSVCMQLKMFVLSASALALWLIPLTALNKKISWHKAIQGVSLCAGIACAVKAGNIARKLTEEAEVEVMKTRAIKADIEDEIATEVYVSQKQRQQEAELILSSPGVDVEASRQALEAMYDNNLQDCASTSDNSDYLVYLEVCKSKESGKSSTWIIENILKMGGRKFTDGKTKLEALMNQFGGEK